MTTPAQMLARSTLARELVRDSAAKLSTAATEVSSIVGSRHDATHSVLEALRAAQIAAAKIDTLIRAIGRIPQ